MSSPSEPHPPGGDVEELKRAAAHEVVERYVEDDMVLGLGSGTTAFLAVRRIGELLSSGELSGVRGVPTSEATAALAREVGVPLVSLAEERPRLGIDGADEVSPELEAMKGWGGALLREKIVASSCEEGFVIVADDSKVVETLGVGPLPVEVEPFGYEATFEALAKLGCVPELRRKDGETFITDGGNYTADCQFPPITEPETLEREIKRIPGALECGLFVGLAFAAVIAGGEAGVRVIER